jgi:tetratricopeptide (TPR) repeat protein
MISTEANYIETLEALYPQQEAASVEVLALAEKAVTEFPNSAKLWCIRGDLIQLGTSEAKYELNNALESYERAIAVDPSFAEAYESIGFFYDAVMDDPESAEPAFRKAIEFGAGQNSYYGLARVLAELNQMEEALKILAPESCPHQDDPDIKQIKDEIESGMWFNESRA